MTTARRLLSRARLLTLTGAGGVGKTRLALRVAESLKPAFCDGVEVVELAALEDGELLEPTVAAALGVRDAGPAPMAVLVDYLADKRMLLVLDNCEHLLPDCVRLVDLLLRGAVRLRILATSRQTLGVAGEQVLVVPSLSVPDLGGTVRDIVRSEAVRMFADRGSRVRPGFAVDSGSAPAVARLCRRLGGIPLAIELAAGRLRAMQVEELARELDQRFAVLDAGWRAATLPRHQTLRATVDWSFGLCTPAEQRLWSRLSMFAGGVDVDTAEDVCHGDDIAREDVFDLLAGLVDKSVLTVERRDDGIRYHMLDSIRMYGRERLADGGEQALRRRFNDHYLRLVEEHRVDRLIPEQLACYQVTQVELPNIRVAMELCLSRPDDAPMCLRMASAMWAYWKLAGSLAEGRHWLERGLELVSPDDPARRTALWVAGMLAVCQGDLAATVPKLEESLLLARQAGDEQTRAFATQVSGMAAFSAGDIRRGMALMEEARAGHRARGDLSAVGINMFYDATYSADENPDRAAELAQAFLTMCDECQALVSRGYALFAVGITAWHQGQPHRAEAMMKEAAAFRSAINDRWGLTECVEVLAWIACSYGQYERAARMLGVAHSLWQAMGVSPTLLWHHVRAHEICAAQARQSLGGRAYAAAFRSGERLGLDRAVPYVVEG
ncbi:LuxR family transcriptional regulator [Nonomuraea sp. NPDC005983]|uniref:ATP-binding protein n=1 Tax=Nonomuraea sp. NPDC005983 TaxID=3155595 RepID=UPI0033B63192